MLKRSTLIVVGIFIILLIVAVLILRNQENVAEESGLTTESSYLIDVGASEIIAMEIQDSDGSKVVVRRDTEGKWIMVEPPNEIADESRIESAVSQAGTMRTVSILDLEVDLADLGLDQPKNWIVLTLSNGEQKTAFIGDVTPTNSGYYAYSSGVPVQVVNKANVDGVLGILTEPPILTQPESEDIE
jgi:hypothetical protein